MTSRRHHQWFTPLWAAEALLERYFPTLSADDFLLEPSCGDGRFLQAFRAIAPTTQALGIEIDPVLAAHAQTRSGFPVLVGDFRTLPLAVTPTAIIGNPPFDAAIIDGFLARAHALLPDDGRVGFIVPCYLFQTASRTLRYAQDWRLHQEMIPRSLFPNLSLPLLFAQFVKSRHRTMVGFALYLETHAIQQLTPETRATLTTGQSPHSIWYQAVADALTTLGGEASLTALYHYLEDRRPTATDWWRPKIRQTLQRYFRKTGPARYAMMPT